MHAWLYIVRICVRLCRLYSSQTFRWGDRIAGLVGAVVVDHVVGAHPVILPGLVRGQLLIWHAFPPIVEIRCTIRWPWDLATIDVEVFVVGIEWSFVPVYFLKATPCRPIIGFPQCGVYSHRLLFWVWHSDGFVIFVNPNGDIIHRKAAVIFVSYNWGILSHNLLRYDI